MLNSTPMCDSKVAPSRFMQLFTFRTGKLGALIGAMFLLSVQVALAQPANDECAGAVTLTPSTLSTCSSSVTGSLEFASASVATNCTGISLVNPIKDVWYKFTATYTTHKITVHPTQAGSNLRPSINLYSGACGSLTSVSCVAAAAGGSDAVMQATNLVIGQTYYVRVFHERGGSSTTPEFSVCVSMPNITVTGNKDHGSICVNTNGAQITYTLFNTTSGQAQNITITSSNPEFVVTGGPATVNGQKTASFRIKFSPVNTGDRTSTITVATSIGTETFKVYGTAGPNSPTVTTQDATSISYTSAVLNGNVIDLGVCPNTTQQGFVYSTTAASNNPVAGGPGVTKVTVTPLAEGVYSYDLSGLVGATSYTYRSFLYDGTTYTYGTAKTFSTIFITNDNCNSAIGLTPASSGVCETLTNGSVYGATTSLTETCDGSELTDVADVWYSFVATSTTHRITVTPGGSTFDVVINLREGGCNGTTKQCEDNGGYGVEEVMTASGLTVGNTYYVRIYSYYGDIPADHQFTVCVTTPCLTNIFSGSGNWSDGTHWSCGEAPLAVSTQEVIIAADAQPVLDVDYEVASGGTFFMNAGSYLVIQPNITMKVTGIADFNGRLVRVRSTSAGNAVIGQSTGQILNATNFTVDRYIPQNTSRAWRLLSVPTKGSQTIHQSWQEDQPALIDGVPGFGTIITSKLSNWASTGFDARTADYSLKYFNATTQALAGVTTTLTPIETTAGYFMYIRGDRSVKPSGSTSTISDVHLRTKGTIYTGTQPAISVPAGTDKLVGNIYPSPVDMRALTATYPVITVWDPKLSGTYGLGGYQTFTYDEGDYIVSPGGGSYGDQATINNIIQPGQAFFVTAPSASSASIQFTEAAKTGQGNGYDVFKVQPGSSQLFKARLYAVKDENPILADGVLQLFGTDFSNGVDDGDVVKHFNIGESFYIHASQKDLAIERRNTFQVTDTIQFGMKNMAGKLYQLDFAIDNLNDGNLTAWLEDSYTKQRTLVNLNGTTSVKFSVDASDAASKAVDRFRIVFTGNGVLAVTYTDIRAYQKDKAVAVEWKAENQKNISNYIIERSLNGTDFAQAGTQKPTGTADQTVEYQWLDNSPAAGNNFYRVTSVDINGIKNYSKVVKVAFGAAAGFSIYPNPVTNGNISLHFNGMTKGSYTVRVLSASGALLYTKQLTYNGGDEVQTLSLGRRLVPTGRYFLELVQPDQSRTTQPLVISSK